MLLRFNMKLSDQTSYERDVKVVRESLITAASRGSQGIQLEILAEHTKE